MARMMLDRRGRPRRLAEDAQAGVLALGAAVAGDPEPGQGDDDEQRPATGSSSADATTTSAARATRKPSAPPPLPSRRLAPATTSLITRQASDGADQAGEAPAPSGAVEQEADDEADHGGEQGHPAAGGAVGAGGAGEHPDRDADAELGRESPRAKT